MDSARLSALGLSDIYSLYADCGLPGSEINYKPTRQRMIEDILSWQRKRRSVESPLTVATPSRLACRRINFGTKASCRECGWGIPGGLCSCGFLKMDPLRPVVEVLALVQLQPDSRLKPVYGGAKVELHCRQGSAEENVELRMARLDDPTRHRWPQSLAIFLHGKEAARIDAPTEGRRRAEAPLDLSPHLQSVDVHRLRIEACGGDRVISDFVVCIVRTGASRTVHDLVNEARMSTPFSMQETAQLWMSLRRGEHPPEEDGVECSSPWEQPLLCPLTREHLGLPARGRACRHVQCFDLEAYLRTSVATTFHRRWHCPICDSWLPPCDLAVCSLTSELLQKADKGTLAMPLEAVFAGTMTSLGGGPVMQPVEACRRRWRRHVLTVGTPAPCKALVSSNNGVQCIRPESSHQIGAWSRRLLGSKGGVIADLD